MGSTIKFFVCFFRKFLDHHHQTKVSLNRKLTYVVLIVTLNSSLLIPCSVNVFILWLCYLIKDKAQPIRLPLLIGHPSASLFILWLCNLIKAKAWPNQASTVHRPRSSIKSLD